MAKAPTASSDVEQRGGVAQAAWDLFEDDMATVFEEAPWFIGEVVDGCRPRGGSPWFTCSSSQLLRRRFVSSIAGFFASGEKTSGRSVATMESSRRKEQVITVTQLPQGDINLLDHDIAQRLLISKELARVSYLALDGTPRVVPMMFHWNGENRELILIAFTSTWKVAALRKRPDIAITIDTSSGVRPEILSIRGQATVSDVEGIAPEYVLMNNRYLGEHWAELRIDEVRELGMEMVRIAVRPTWVGVLDFKTRFPGGRTIDDFRRTHFYV